MSSIPAVKKNNKQTNIQKSKNKNNWLGRLRALLIQKLC